MARGLYSDTDSAVYHITWHRDPLLRFAANLEEGRWLFDLVGKAKPGGGPACVYLGAMRAAVCGVRRC